MSVKVDLNLILSKFNIKSKIQDYGNGHINDTYCTETPKYILQRINTEIFKNPDELMQNIDNVTFFLREKIVDAMAAGEIPVRVTHNDTKINNILFDEKTREAICVIDLDTVMSGRMLYDFGDALRMGGSTGAEDEVDLSKVNFDKEEFKRFAQGYIEEMGSKLINLREKQR